MRERWENIRSGRRGWLGAGCLALLAVSVPASAEEAPLPHMKWDGETLCTQDAEGHPLRLQCDKARKVCLYSSTTELRRDGKPSNISLERLNSYCRPDPDEETAWITLHREGYTFSRGIAEAPPGWARDERGRVFQVSFDLQRRLYLGAGFMTTFSASSPDAWPSGGLQQLNRPSFDFGFHAEAVDDDDDSFSRHRFGVGEGRIDLSPFSFDITTFVWDGSWVSESPLLRITTFVGQPARHDLYADIGGGIRLLQFRQDSVMAPGLTEARWLEPSLHWNLAHGRQLNNYLRLYTSLSLDRLFWRQTDLTEDEGAVVFKAALQGRATLDKRGFNLVAFETAWEKAAYFNGTATDLARGGAGYRAQAELSYERILIAINDQPLTLYLRGGGIFRGDLPGDDNYVGYSGMLGLRYSFWAPAPEDAEAN